MNSIRKSAALAAALITCTGLLITAAPASAVDSEPFVVVQANLGSGVDSDLNSNKVFDGGFGGAEDPILAVSDKARAYGAHVITLQEVCSEDVERMRVHLQNITGAAWTASTFAQMQGPSANYPNSCQQPGRPGASTNAKGNVMFSRLGIYGGEDTVSYLGTADGRTNTLACMNVPFAGSAADGARTTVCNTHLPAVKKDSAGNDTNAAERLAQAQRMKNGIAAATVNNHAYSASGGTDAMEARVPTVIAGDFNTGLKTNVQDLFHRINRAGTGLNTTGKFWEADHETNQAACSYGFCRDGASTLDSGCCKYDYVYFGKTYGKGPASVDFDVHGNPTGNHKIIVSQSRFTW